VFRLKDALVQCFTKMRRAAAQAVGKRTLANNRSKRDALTRDGCGDRIACGERVPCGKGEIPFGKDKVDVALFGMQACC
jgi:hypothetical protein